MELCLGRQRIYDVGAGRHSDVGTLRAFVMAASPNQGSTDLCFGQTDWVLLVAHEHRLTPIRDWTRPQKGDHYRRDRRNHWRFLQGNS